jgi:hypothetical protein
MAKARWRQIKAPVQGGTFRGTHQGAEGLDVRDHVGQPIFRGDNRANLSRRKEADL